MRRRFRRACPRSGWKSSGVPPESAPSKLAGAGDSEDPQADPTSPATTNAAKQKTTPGLMRNTSGTISNDTDSSRQARAFAVRSVRAAAGAGVVVTAIAGAEGAVVALPLREERAADRVAVVVRRNRSLSSHASIHSSRLPFMSKMPGYPPSHFRKASHALAPPSRSMPLQRDETKRAPASTPRRAPAEHRSRRAVSPWSTRDALRQARTAKTGM